MRQDSGSAHGGAFKEYRKVRVLSETSFYTSSGSSFKILILERTLEGSFDSPRLSDGSGEFIIIVLLNVCVCVIDYYSLLLVYE